MRQIYRILLLAIVAALLAGCGASSDAPSSQPPAPTSTVQREGALPVPTVDGADPSPESTAQSAPTQDAAIVPTNPPPGEQEPTATAAPIEAAQPKGRAKLSFYTADG